MAHKARASLLASQDAAEAAGDGAQGGVVQLLRVAPAAIAQVQHVIVLYKG